jgi:hypothetical protein
VVLLLAVFTIPESVTGQHLIRQVASALRGGSFHSDISPRMGLDRAFGSFQHPILYGVFAAGALGPAWYALSQDTRITAGRAARTIGVACAAVASVSSGAVAVMMVQSIGMTWDRLTRGLVYRWLGLTVGIIGAYFFVDALSNRSGMRVFLAYLTFSPSTAYGRLVIWEYGSAEVLRNPIFGIGFNDWEHPAWLSGGVDDFWLLNAMRHGLPGAAALAVAVMSTWWATSREHLNESTALARSGWVTCLLGLVIAGWTVHFWNQTFAFFCFWLGAGGWLVSGLRASKATHS